jgi:hypothetical protein
MGDSWSPDSEYEASPLQRSGEAVWQEFHQQRASAIPSTLFTVISLRAWKAMRMTEMTESGLTVPARADKQSIIADDTEYESNG